MAHMVFRFAYRISLIFLLLATNVFSDKFEGLNQEELRNIAVKVLESLKKDQVIPSSTEISSVKNHFFENVYKGTIVTTVNPDLIVKLFDETTMSLFNDDSSDIERVKKIAKDLDALNSEKYDIPLLINYIAAKKLADGTGVIVMEKAKGESLKSIIGNFSNMSSEEVAKIFESIGEHYGNLRRLYREKEAPHLKFGDDNFENVFFDTKTNKTTWIDLLGDASDLDYKKITNINNILPNYSSLFITLLRSIFDADVKDDGVLTSITAATMAKMKCEDLPSVVEIVKKRIVAVTSVDKGFLKAIKKLNIKDEYKNDIVKKIVNARVKDWDKMGKDLAKMNRLYCDCFPPFKLPETD